MGRPLYPNGIAGDARVDWVDYAKGICILFVVMMHSTLGVGNAVGQEGWLHSVVAFAQPFRMPDFFLISGLFLARVIDRDWRTYLDRKVVHFVYFYLLWTAIQFAVKAPVFLHEHGLRGMAWLYLETFWEPFGTLWFIYLLPIFFVTAKLAHSRHIAGADLACRRGARDGAYPHRLDRGRRIREPFRVLLHRLPACSAHLHACKRGAGQAGVALAGLTFGASQWRCWSSTAWRSLPFVSLALGLAGAMAVVTVSALMAKHDLFKPLRYCGQNSIVIYLAFFLPMAVARMALIKTGWITDVGTISAIVTLVGVLGALATFWAVRRTFLRFLFERPGAVLDRAQEASRPPAGAVIGAELSPSLGGEGASGMLSPDHASQRIPERQKRANLHRSECNDRAGGRPSRSAKKGRSRLPGRRFGLHLSRLRRAAAAIAQVGWAAAQRRLWLLQHALEASARYEAGGASNPPRDRVRQIGADLPHRDVSGL